MKVLCKYISGKDLKPYEVKPLEKGEFGRFGASESTEYGELEIGKKYLVMGILVFETYHAYLIDGNGFISACPCQLFEIIDGNIPVNWVFRTIDKNEGIYPFLQAIMGYPELSSNKNAYEDLILEKDEEAERIYFKRKIELEKELG
jgi:hypothetical protein